jgi:hypothetical protein
MPQNFFALRERICAMPHLSVQPFAVPVTVAGKCWHNATYVINRFGGSLAYGWALSSTGPVPVSGSKLPALYGRWINHVVWRDPSDRLWEVTPHADFFGSGITARAAIFVVDEYARFDTASEASCCPLPAVYIAMRPEGEWTADCLNAAERCPVELQAYWLDRALYSVRQAGFTPTNWRVDRMHDKINDAWILA